MRYFVNHFSVGFNNLEKIGFEPRDIHYNTFSWSRDFESDITVFEKCGSLVEIEWKNNLEDFSIDFFKNAGGYSRKLEKRRPRRKRVDDPTIVYKHDLLKNRNVPLKQFYFACPGGVIPREKIPEYAGLIYIEPDFFNTGQAFMIKKAPILSKEKQHSYLW